MGPGTVHLSINGAPVGKAAIANFGCGFNAETLDIGSDLGSPVSAAYKSPFAFTGKIEAVKVDLL